MTSLLHSVVARIRLCKFMFRQNLLGPVTVEAINSLQATNNKFPAPGVHYYITHTVQSFHSEIKAFLEEKVRCYWDFELKIFGKCLYRRVIYPESPVIQNLEEFTWVL